MQRFLFPVLIFIFFLSFSFVFPRQVLSNSKRLEVFYDARFHDEDYNFFWNFLDETENYRTQQEATRLLKRQVPGLKVIFHSLTKTPRWIFSESSSLFRREKSLMQKSPTDFQKVVTDFVAAQTAIFQIEAAELGNNLKRNAHTKRASFRNICWQQERHGIPIFGAEFRAVLDNDKTGELWSVSSTMLPYPEPDTQPLEILPDPRRLKTWAKHHLEIGADQMEVKGRKHWYFPVKPGELREAVSVNILAKGPEQYESYLLLMDARNGDLFYRTLTSLSHHALDTFEVPEANGIEFLVFANGENSQPLDSPEPWSNGAGPAFPSKEQGVPAAQELIIAPVNPLASPWGWAFGEETYGNNVDVFIDHDLVFGNNAMERISMNHARGFVYPFPIDLDLSDDGNQFLDPLAWLHFPALHKEASATNAFYVSNWFHDQAYDLGFTPEYANFQVLNPEGMGVGDDPMRIHVQHSLDAASAGIFANNAVFHFFDGLDGTPPDVVAYVFSGPRPARDSVMDNQLLIHEFTHGLQIRLMGGAEAMGPHIAYGLSEGFADFYALAMLSRPGNDPAAANPVGGYITHRFHHITPPFVENYYHGIRRTTYSTDLQKSPLTFADLDPDQFALDLASIGPIASDNPMETHNMGEVWALFLWEVRALLIQEYGLIEGNKRSLELITDSIKLTPPWPLFTDARDAILMADRIANGGAHRCLIWKGFAKRGLGPDAKNPNEYFTIDLIESFRIPTDCTQTLPLTPTESMPL